MFISLRFPDGKEYPEYPLPREGFRGELPLSASFDDRQREVLLHYLFLACPVPEVLSYRAELAEELVSSPELEQIFRDLGQFSIPKPHRSHAAESEEIKKLQLVTAFQAFGEEFDRFCDSLDRMIPDSAAAKRCFLFCRNYRESFEYKELKIKARELLEALGFSYGFSLAVGNPNDLREPARLSKESAPPEGIRNSANRLMAEFGVLPEEPKQAPRPYTDVEVAVLTGMIRNDPKLVRRLNEFGELYTAAGTEDILRLGREALYFISANELYKAGRAAGYALCRPTFRNPGFYSSLTGMTYPSAHGTPQKADYVASPLNHITVVCGPDSEPYLNAVAFAHLSASSGGLVFAEEAAVAPVNSLQTDRRERLSMENLDEDGLCLCSHLFDAMLPRQEEAAVSEVLLRLAERNSRSVVRICSKGNLAVLQKNTEGGRLPPCTFLEAGTDRTLEELLQRHRLTPQKEADQ